MTRKLNETKMYNRTQTLVVQTLLFCICSHFRVIFKTVTELHETSFMLLTSDSVVIICKTIAWQGLQKIFSHKFYKCGARGVIWTHIKSLCKIICYWSYLPLSILKYRTLIMFYIMRISVVLNFAIMQNVVFVNVFFFTKLIEQQGFRHFVAKQGSNKDHLL